MNERMNKRMRAARWYAALLRLYPRAHRQAFGAQMLQTFQDHYRDAIESGEQSEWRFWLGVVADEGRSIATERIAALAERESRMQALKRAPTIALTLAALAAFFWLVGRTWIAFPAQGALWAGLIALDAGLVAILARVAPLFLGAQTPADRRPGWLRAGLALGAALSGYMVIISLLYAFFPVAPQIGDSAPPYDLGLVWLASLPLLGGALGVLTRHVCNPRRRGARLYAGLLAIGASSLAYVASQALLIALLWEDLQQNLLQSRLEMTYQAWYGQTLGWSQFTNQPLTLQQFVSSTYGIGGFGVVLLLGLEWLILAWLFAALGSALGAASQRAQAHRRQRSAPGGAQPEPARRSRGARSAVGLVLFLLCFGVLTQLGSSMTRDVGVFGPQPATFAFSQLFNLNVLSHSFISSSIAAWLIALLIASIWVVMATRASRASEGA